MFYHFWIPIVFIKLPRQQVICHYDRLFITMSQKGKSGTHRSYNYWLRARKGFRDNLIPSPETLGDFPSLSIAVCSNSQFRIHLFLLRITLSLKGSSDYLSIRNHQRSQNILHGILGWRIGIEILSSHQPMTHLLRGNQVEYNGVKKTQASTASSLSVNSIPGLDQIPTEILLDLIFGLGLPEN